jgi:hypothetical protein
MSNGQPNGSADHLSIERCEPPDVDEPAPCYRCGSLDCHVLNKIGPLCNDCAGIQPADPEPAIYRGDIPNWNRRPIGPSPYPCPRCGSVVNITCSYQGRREEWTCGHCNFGWSMNATPEQST